MSARNRRRQCSYCGLEKKITSDHVPPKLFLEQPRPPNLLTVPSCSDCNQSFMADDEYTRAVLGADIRANWNYAAQSNMPAIVRSLQRPDARGLADYVSRESHLMDVLAANGSPVMAKKIDSQRVNRSGLYILRGLYFHEMGRRLSGTSSIVRVGSQTGLTSRDLEIVTVARVFQTLPDQRNGAAGTAFSYTAAFGPHLSVWLMLLYDYFFGLATIDEREEHERAADADQADYASRMVFA
jgi:hypothetical protein